MNIAGAAVEKRTVTTFATVVLIAAGLASYFGLGQLEDPEFTVKTAVIMTAYPGAMAEEVELEVTDRVEIAIQEMPQLKEIESFSRGGLSLVSVTIQSKYTSDALPQIWDELRKKVGDMEGDLPPGAGTPVVSDDFGDVFGFFFAVVGDGFSPAKLETYVDTIKKELSLVQGVARVDTWGVQSQCIYVDVAQARLSQLGVTMADVQRTLSNQNVVVNAGGVDISPERLRIEVTGEFRSPEDIEDLVIYGRDERGATGTNLLRIRDFAEVRRGYVEPAMKMMRFDGAPAIGISLANVSGENIVALGQRIDQRLDELLEVLPVGIEVERISWQSDQVATAISDFMVSLAQAVGIVLLVLWLAMGLRTALIVGLCGLVFVIIATFMVMNMTGVDLQRMSLGALVIAMGMMVDNAIVVVDGIVVRMQRGVPRVKAAIEAASQPATPLLGATIVAVMAFYPIFASDESAGEYCATLFSVVGISLMISWVLSVTATPVLCIALLPEPKKTDSDADQYGGAMFRVYHGVLVKAIRLRWGVVVVLLAMLVGAGALFGKIDRMFFPAADRAQIMVDYWAPEGTRIQETSALLRPLEAYLADHPSVVATSTFVGGGPPRFYLPVDPESPYASYGQIIANTTDGKVIDEVIADLQAWTDTNVAEAIVVIRKYGLGPSETWPVEARVSGPAIADPAVLRSIGEEMTKIIEQSPHARVVRTDWRQRTKKLVADYDETNARWVSISRGDIADTTRRGYDGLPVGQFRDRDKLLPIFLRHVQSERAHVASAPDLLQVRAPLATQSVPMSQVTRSLDIEWEDPLIWRWDRRRAITVGAVPLGLAGVLRADVLADIEAVRLPPGYDLMWDGEFRSAQEAQQSLIPGMIPAVLVMALIVVGLFNAYRPPIIIAAVIPFAMIGVVVGLLVTDQPFGFVALLGAMSLSGMMIKNAIVLLDQVNIELAEGKPAYTAVVDSCLSRLRPVMLAAGTTVLGVIPLLGDVFWIAMAVTIMFGLAFGAVLTMIAVPVFYACLFRLKAE